MEINFDRIIIGEHIILRKVDLNDANDIFTWRTGKSGLLLHHPKGYSVKMQEDWIKSRDEKEINYIIQVKKNSENIGTISIYNVNSTDQIAEVGRLLLNDYYLTKSNPYGLEALLLCYNYVFNVMDFRKITGGVISSYQAILNLQLFLGMKQEGCLEKHTLINGNFEDLHILSIFKDQFNNTYKKKINFLLKSFK